MNDAPAPPNGPFGKDLPAENGDEVITNRKAIACLIFGVAGFLCLFVFPFGAFALGIPTMTTGIHGRREIALSHGDETGDQLAVSGLIIGGAGLVFALISFGLAGFPA